MNGIGATRSSTGENVELAIDDDGRLSARTPDGSSLQSQPIRASRLKLKDRQLTWSGVKYDVDDQAEARRFVDSLGPSKMSKRGVALRVLLLLAVLAAGFVGGVYARDRRSDINCDTAREVVDNSLQTLEGLNETETQDQSFFAAVIVEQRTITYAMETESRCFSLQERAGAAGLLDGIRGLLNTASG